MAACASGSRPAATRSHSAQTTVARRPIGPGGFWASDTDADRDDTGEQSFYLKPSHHDSFVAENAGQEAARADRRAIAALVERYYAAGAADDGARACPMLSPALRAGLSETLGSTDRTGGTIACAAALSQFFKQQRQLLKADVAPVVVVDVRVRHDRATALLGFRTIPVGSIDLEREHGAWKLDALIHKALAS